jgi:site-specific recombinase XerD
MLSDQFIDSLPALQKQKDYFDANFKGKGSFGIRVGRGGTRTFFILFEQGGKRKRVSLGRYPDIRTSEARSKASSMLRRIRLSERSPLPESSRKSPSSIPGQIIQLNNLAARFIHYCSISGKSQKTIAEYQRLFNKEILPVIGQLDIRSVKKIHVQEIYEELLLQRKAPILANRVRSLLHRLFTFAIERELRSTNPVEKIKRIPESSRNRQPLSVEELQKLFFLLQSKYSETANAALFSLVSGQKLSHVCSLSWNNFTQGYWEIEDEVTSSKVFLYLNDLARSVLNMKFETKAKSSFIFSSREGRPLKYIEKSIKAFGKEASIDTPITATRINQSIRTCLYEFSECINPKLQNLEIEAFMNPASILKKLNSGLGSNPQKAIPITNEIGKRPAELLENLLILGPEKTSLNLNKQREDSKGDLDITNENNSSGNVIYIPRERWSKSKPKDK